MFNLQNMTYKDFLQANTNYKNVDQEEYLNALNISLGEDSVFFFEDDNVILVIDEWVQNDVGKIISLIDEEEVFL